MPTDLAFLDMSKYSAEIRVQFLTSYLRQFDGAGLKPRELTAMRDAKEVRQIPSIRHHFGPFLTCFSALYHPTRSV